MDQLDENPFTRTTFGQAFGRTLDVFFARFDVFAVIAVLMYIPYALIQATTVHYTTTESSSFDDILAMQNPIEAALSDVFNQRSALVAVIELVFEGLVGIIGKAAISLAVARMYTAEETATSRPPLSVVSFLKDGLTQFCPLLCASAIIHIWNAVGTALVFSFAAWMLHCQSNVLAPVAFLLGATVLFVVAFVQVSLLLVIPVLVVERKSLTDGLMRAWTLANDNRCYIFCIYYSLSLTMSLVSLVVSKVLFDGFFGTVLKTIPFLFKFPLSGILIAVVYLNIRIEREGLNEQVLSRELDGKPPLVYAPVIASDDEEEEKTFSGV